MKIPKKQEFVPFNNYSFDAIEGKHSAVIAAEVDGGMEDFKGDGKYKPKVILCYQLEGKGSDGFDKVIPVKYTLSSFEKGNLRRDMENAELWDLIEKNNMDTACVVGKPVKLKLVLKTSDKGHSYPVVKQITDDDNDIKPTWRPEKVDREAAESSGDADDNIPF